MPWRVYDHSLLFPNNRVMLTYSHRTMAWAIDLDDGTTIDALGSDLSRPKSQVFDQSLLDPNSNTTDLGSNSSG